MDVELDGGTADVDAVRTARIRPVAGDLDDAASVDGGLLVPCFHRNAGHSLLQCGRVGDHRISCNRTRPARKDCTRCLGAGQGRPSDADGGAVLSRSVPRYTIDDLTAAVVEVIVR